MFNITNKKINHSLEASELYTPAAGGLVFFEGRVRNHNNGLKVDSLEYQCYESMAIKEGEKILERATQKFDIHFAKCLHRHGHLSLGDIAIWVGVSSSHRKEAFLACEYIVDEVKATVPIWKKEYYADKPAVWVECHRCQKNHQYDDHYQEQLSL